MRAILYLRVSQDVKREKRSVGEQESDAIIVCGEQTWTIVEKFQDDSLSASRHAKKERPDYNTMIEYIRDGNCDVLVLWEVSRGDRQMDTWTPLLTLCRKMGVLIHVIKDDKTYDPRKPRDRKSLLEDGIDAEYESEKTRDRVMRSVRANAIAGRPHGKLKYGYTRTYDEKGSFVSQDVVEEIAEIIREAAKRVSEGEACNSVAKDFNVRPIPAPQGGKWDLSQIRRMVTDPAYIGMRVHQGVVVGKAVWPAIINEKIYNTCVEIMSDPKRNSVRDGSIKHLLSGIAQCGKCDAPVKILKNRGVLSYQCGTSFCTSIPIARLDTYVIEKLKERLYHVEISEVEEENGDLNRKAAKLEAAELQDRLDAFTLDAAMGRMSGTALGKIEAELQPLIDDAIKRSRARVSKEFLYEMIENPELFDRKTVPQRRQLLRDMCTIHIDLIGRGRRNYEMDERVRIDFGDDKAQSVHVEGW